MITIFRRAKRRGNLVAERDALRQEVRRQVIPFGRAVSSNMIPGTLLPGVKLVQPVYICPAGEEGANETR